MTDRMRERRSSERFNTHLEGRIVPDNGSSSVECVMCDLSSTGARLAFPRPAEMPLAFELYISDEGASARGRLIWSNGKEHWIKFTDETPEA